MCSDRGVLTSNIVCAGFLLDEPASLLCSLSYEVCQYSNQFANSLNCV